MNLLGTAAWVLLLIVVALVAVLLFLALRTRSGGVLGGGSGRKPVHGGANEADLRQMVADKTAVAALPALTAADEASIAALLEPAYGARLGDMGLGRMNRNADVRRLRAEIVAFAQPVIFSAMEQLTVARTPMPVQNVALSEYLADLSVIHALDLGRRGRDTLQPVVLDALNGRATAADMATAAGAAETLLRDLRNPIAAAAVATAAAAAATAAAAAAGAGAAAAAPLAPAPAPGGAGGAGGAGAAAAAAPLAPVPAPGGAGAGGAGAGAGGAGAGAGGPPVAAPAPAPAGAGGAGAGAGGPPVAAPAPAPAPAAAVDDEDDGPPTWRAPEFVPSAGAPRAAVVAEPRTAEAFPHRGPTQGVVPPAVAVVASEAGLDAAKKAYLAASRAGRGAASAGANYPVYVLVTGKPGGADDAALLRAVQARLRVAVPGAAPAKKGPPGKAAALPPGARLVRLVTLGEGNSTQVLAEEVPGY
jgi:hypothetical protein